ncbi:amino acid transporter, partial [Streptomyces sp. Da 82-17]
MSEQPTTTKVAAPSGAADKTPSPAVPADSGDGLKAGLKNRHLSMIAIGGVIGAGLFVGSGAGIAAAG